MTTSKEFVVMAILLTSDLVAERYLVSECEKKQTGLYSSGKLSSEQRSTINQAPAGVYGFGSAFDRFQKKLDPNITKLLKQINGLAQNVSSLHENQRQYKA
jgi:hypothetical protein